jgi:cytoskeletal protein CcmA (bactofilin family)
MGDISTWSPVDESNTAAVPNGWPEGQATNTVNNCARAMMGAVRRWYDTVTAQLASLTSSLANYLPLSGGTLTGSLSAPVYQISGTVFAQRDAGAAYHYIYNADGVDPALILGGAESLYRAETHYFQSNEGTATFATLNIGGFALTGNITATGNITGNVLTGSAVNSNGHMAAVGNVTAGGSIAAPNASISGTVQANQLTSNLDIDAVRHIDAGGTITGAAIVGNTVHANTTLSAGTSVAAPTITASGNMSAANLSTASSISAGTWINAPQYRLNGVPIEFGVLFEELHDLQQRVRALERVPA